MYIGFGVIKQVALAAGAFVTVRHGQKARGVSLKQLQRHSVLTGMIAAEMFDEKPARDEAFTAGLLHDVGKLVLATRLPWMFEEVVALVHAEKIPMHVVENRLAGVTHAEVGGYLLGLWGLPYPIVEAVANHHAPSRVEQRGFDLLAAVHIADALANEVLDSTAGGGSGYAGLDPVWLERLGVSDRIVAWRAIAEEKGVRCA
jgi:HD-like signal output (HDOD) protein